MMSNRTANCLSARQMQLTMNGVDHFIERHIFPVQFVLGVLGNLVNLFVLLRDMRSTANDLLAAMACADLALLVCMLPQSLAGFQIFAENYSFRYIYFLTKTHQAALANWFSAAAIWLILAVSIERLMGIRSPMHTRFYWKRRRMVGFVLCVFGVSAALTFHHHLAYDCSLRKLCNGTQLIAVYTAVASEWEGNGTNPHSLLKQQYLRLSTAANALLVVIIPIVAVTALNISLIRALKRHDLKRDSFGMVTVTVCAIVTCFTLTQGPSTIAFIWELITKKEQTVGYFYTLISVANNLVVTGKVLNFILFCLCSAHYRRRLREVVVHRIKCLTPYRQKSSAGSFCQLRSGHELTGTTGLELNGVNRQSTSSRRQTASDRS